MCGTFSTEKDSSEIERDRSDYAAENSLINSSEVGPVSKSRPRTLVVLFFIYLSTTRNGKGDIVRQ